jgi:hypothetical protein
VRRKHVAHVFGMEGMRILVGVPSSRETDPVHSLRTVMVPAAKGKPDNGWQGYNNRGTNGKVYLLHQEDLFSTLPRSMDWHLLKDVNMDVLSRGALDAAVDRLPAFGPGVTPHSTPSNGEQFELSSRFTIRRSGLRPLNGAPRLKEASFDSCVANIYGAAAGATIKAVYGRDALARPGPVAVHTQLGYGTEITRSGGFRKLGSAGGRAKASVLWSVFKNGEEVKTVSLKHIVTGVGQNPTLCN